MTAAEVASALITTFEGCKLTAYQDTAGIWTIGHGHTGTVNGWPVQAGMTITQEQADALMQEDMAGLFKLVAGRPLIEAGALVSFGYNCGIGSLGLVLGGHRTLTSFETDRHGNKLSWLVTRRNLEETLILASQQMARK